MQTLDSDFLFVQPSFWYGFCRTVDLFGRFDVYNESLSTVEADHLALASDWYMLGQDARNALQEFEGEMKKKNVSLALD